MSDDRTLEAATGFEAAHYLSGHHIGLVDPATYRDRLSRYTAKLREREHRLLDYLREPHTLDAYFGEVEQAEEME